MSQEVLDDRSQLREIYRDLGDEHTRLLALLGKIKGTRSVVALLPMLEELLAPRLLAHPAGLWRDLRLDLKLTALDLSGVAPLARPALRARLVEMVENALIEAEARRRNQKAPSPRTAGCRQNARQPSRHL